MGATEDRYFERRPGEISLLPSIDIDLARAALVVIDMQYHDAHAERGIVAALEKLHPGSTAYYAERLATVVPATTNRTAPISRNTPHSPRARRGSRAIARRM